MLDQTSPPAAPAAPAAPGDELSLSVSPGELEPLDSDEEVEEIVTVDTDLPPTLGALPREPARPPSPSRPSPSAGPPPTLARPRGPDPSPAPAPGNVIYFPGPRGGRRDTEGPHALAARETLPFPQPDSPSLPPMDLGPGPAASAPRGRPRRALPDDSLKPNWWRIGAVVLSGLVILGAVRWYVAMNSTADFGAPVQRSTVAAPPGAPAVVTPTSTQPSSARPTAAATPVERFEDSAQEDPYQDLEQELRGQLRSGLLPVESAGDLESALLIELNHVRLDVISIDINVLGTAGESLLPESVEVRVRLRDPDSDLARQLAAASLVVGKYAQHLDLAVPLFEVGFPAGDDKIKRVRIDIDTARALFLGRLSLRDFLARLIAR